MRKASHSGKGSQKNRVQVQPPEEFFCAQGWALRVSPNRLSCSSCRALAVSSEEPNRHYLCRPWLAPQQYVCTAKPPSAIQAGHATLPHTTWPASSNASHANPSLTLNIKSLPGERPPPHEEPSIGRRDRDEQRAVFRNKQISVHCRGSFIKTLTGGLRPTGSHRWLPPPWRVARNIPDTRRSHQRCHFPTTKVLTRVTFKQEGNNIT